MTNVSVISYQLLLESYLAVRVLRSKSESSYRASVRKLVNGLDDYCYRQRIAFEKDANS